MADWLLAGESVFVHTSRGIYGPVDVFIALNRVCKRSDVIFIFIAGFIVIVVG